MQSSSTQQKYTKIRKESKTTNGLDTRIITLKEKKEQAETQNIASVRLKFFQKGILSLKVVFSKKTNLWFMTSQTHCYRLLLST